MDRKQLIVQKTREYLGNGEEDVLHMVQRDRQELRGWQEPAHLRSVLLPAVREKSTSSTNSSQVAIAEPEIGHGAGEPDKGGQREALGKILEAGAAALQKLLGAGSPELNPEELFGLECVALLYGRPAILANEDSQIDQVPAFWNCLEDQREDIALCLRGVGRIELVGHPDYDWAGTGFLVGETCLMTTRCVAQHFMECSDAGQWGFRPGISALDGLPDRLSTALFRRLPNPARAGRSRSL